MTAFFSEDDLNAQKDALEWRGGKDPMSFTDEDLGELEDLMKATVYWSPKIPALVARLKAAEEIAGRISNEHDEECIPECWMCKPVKAWLKAAGKI